MEEVDTCDVMILEFMLLRALALFLLETGRRNDQYVNVGICSH